MPARLIITADDFGLTRGATDTVLEAVDGGALSCVSVIPNGQAVMYALEEWKKRSDTLSLSLHLNLTEGIALSTPDDIPHLADARGVFRHSPFGLLLKCYALSPKTRRILRQELEKEIGAQIELIRREIGDAPLAVDGHQHIHMIPCVFSILVRAPFARIRMPREPFFVATEFPFAYLSTGLIRHLGLNILSAINRPTAARHGMPHTSHFIGTLLSGTLTMGAVASALGEARRKGAESVEIAFHPGSEPALDGWHGDVAWHASAWRARERELLMDPAFADLLRSFKDDTFAGTGSRVLELARFTTSGILAAATNLGILYVGTELFGAWYMLSASVAFVAAVVVSFLLQKFWTFSHTAGDEVRSREVAFFLANNAFGLVFNAVALYALVEYLAVWYLLAQFLILILLSTWSFFVYRLVIFVRR
ncbi:MAG: ChbG/HpnK family deacetylase [Patescibacteria group bacterium]